MRFLVSLAILFGVHAQALANEETGLILLNRNHSHEVRVICFDPACSKVTLSAVRHFKGSIPSQSNGEITASFEEIKNWVSSQKIERDFLFSRTPTPLAESTVGRSKFLKPFVGLIGVLFAVPTNVHELLTNQNQRVIDLISNFEAELKKLEPNKLKYVDVEIPGSQFEQLVYLTRKSVYVRERALLIRPRLCQNAFN